MSNQQGDRLYSEMFRLPSSRLLEARTVGRGTLAITHLRCDTPGHGVTAPYAPEATFMVSLQLRVLPAHRLLRNGRHFPIEVYPENALTIYDLREQWQAHLVDPFEVVHFHVPATALDTLSDSIATRRISYISSTPARGTVDPAFRHLIEALLPVLGGRMQASQLYSEHVLLAMCEHVAFRYGDPQPRRSLTRGALSPFQTRRAIDFLTRHLAQDVSLEDVASECRVSVSHFIRAFRRTTGTTPHQWLLQRKLERAMQLLASGEALSEIAAECGFCDQSHLTRAFTRRFGVSPGRWRRERMAGPISLG